MFFCMQEVQPQYIEMIYIEATTSRTRSLDLFYLMLYQLVMPYSPVLRYFKEKINHYEKYFSDLL